MRRRVLGFFVLVTLVGACLGASGERGESASLVLSTGTPPCLFYTRPGQFEIITGNATDAQPALDLATAVWAALAEPLDLPDDGFNTPVSLRLMPAAEWTATTPFTVTVEVPGLVSVRVRWGVGGSTDVLRQALVHGVILRRAVSWHGVGAQLTVPLWLEQGCVGLSRVRELPAEMDSFQQESARFVAVPSLVALLQGERGAGLSRDRQLAALWLLLPRPRVSLNSRAAAWGTGWPTATTTFFISRTST